MHPVTISRLLMGAVGLFLLSGMTCTAQEIVWPTYAQVEHTTDASLTCTQLHGTIAHVTSDIAMLKKAHDRTEELVRNQFAYDSSQGTADRGRFRLGTAGDGEQTYLTAREQIGTSHGIALKRLAYLNELLMTCKDGSPQAARSGPAPLQAVH